MTGKTFSELVAGCLVEECGRTAEDSQVLVKWFPAIILAGIMANMDYRATALALEMAEIDEAAKGARENTK